jgi:hypothetical protein
MADEQCEQTSLEQRGNVYTLRRLDADGRLSEIELADTSLLSMLPLIQKVCAHLLANQSTPDLKAQGAESIVTIPVRGFVVGNDLHGTEIYLSLVATTPERVATCLIRWRTLARQFLPAVSATFYST